MGVLFRAIAKNGEMLILNQMDFKRYLTEMEGKEILVELRDHEKAGKKQKLYAYYHKVILDCAVKGWRETGENIDRVTADYKLRAEYAKVFVNDFEGNPVIAIESKSKMTYERFLTYVKDCILFIESNFGVHVPDSQEYLIQKKVGKNYKSI